MARNVTGIPALSYVGVTASTPPQLVRVDRAPTANDYDNFIIGTLWIDYSSMQSDPPVAPAITDVYMLVAKRGLVATWLPLGGTDTITLTGDVGGAVGVDGANNIDLFGTTNRISTTGDPGSYSITWDIGDTVADSYDTDAGTAVPAANVLEIVGSGDISTAGAGNTVTVSFNGANYAIQYTSDAGIAIPVANNLNVVGSGGITTAGAGDTLTIGLSGAFSNQYTTDSGIATPVGNNINIIGGSGVTTSGAGDTVTITSSGVAAQSSFFATISANIPNVVGNNPAYDIPFDTAVYDLNGDFNVGTGKFTAPLNGIYLFNSTVDFGSVTAAMDTTSIKLIVNSGAPGDVELTATQMDPSAIIDFSAGSDEVSVSIFGYIQLTAGDTVKVTVSLDGAAGNTASIGQAASPDYRTWFSGSLVSLV